MRKYNSVYGCMSWFEKAKPSEECNVILYDDGEQRCKNQAVITTVGEFTHSQMKLETRRRSYCKDCVTAAMAKSLKRLDEPDFFSKSEDHVLTKDELFIMAERKEFILAMLDFVNA